MKRMLVALGVMGFLCAATQAQEAKPGADLKKLDVWNGDWAFETQVKDSPSGAEKTYKGTWEQRRMGDHFYVWDGKWTAPDGKEMTDLAITGWDPVTKAYFSEGFDSDGGRGTGVATFSDKSITTDSTSLAATGEKTRTRCTYSLSEQENTGTCETRTDGEWWVSSKAKFTKVK